MANKYTENRMSHIDIPLGISGVYMLTDTITGRFYIGSSKDIRIRAGQHFINMAGSKAKNSKTYANFLLTYSQHGSRAFAAKTLLVCDKKDLLYYEYACIQHYKPTENATHAKFNGNGYLPEECKQHSVRTKELWADPIYREKAIAARKGKAYNKGYKCTEEQKLNRQKAGRISNMKRNYGETWQDEYLRRYPEHAGDILNG
jgi:hypothetical protein